MTPDQTQYGPNSWLIDEMFEQYQADPSSVSESWREFFTDYKPTAEAGAVPTTLPTPTPAPPVPSQSPGEEGEPQLLRGTDAAIVKHMESSLSVPTATSVRHIPAKLLEVNRNILNRQLARARGSKVSFTHLIGYAVAKALADLPAMRASFVLKDGKPHVLQNPSVNFGLAIDVKRADGSRTLLVPNIKDAESLDFARFFTSYEDLIKRTAANKLAPDDFAGTTVTLTNPGTIGTVMSVPRLMSGQSVIVGVGSIGYPAEYEGADPRTLAQIGLGKIITITSTYDHRVIQGAASGEFLRRIHGMLIGNDGFYEEVFRSMGVPYVPVAWLRDTNPALDSIEAEEKQARVLQLINLYRVRGHLIAPLDPLQAEPPTMHPELDPANYGFTLWDLDRDFVTGGLAGRRKATLGEILGILRDAYCRTATFEYMHIQEPDQKQWIQDRVEGVNADLDDADRHQILRKLNEGEAFERFLHQKYVGHKRFSLEGAESLIPMLDALLDDAARSELVEVVIGMSHRGRLNVLANTMHKSYAQIFREFEGDIDPDKPQGSGDVKYHMGATGVHSLADGRTIALTLASNPSHLEAVDPVVEGMVRAKQDALGKGAQYPVLPLLIHGDGAFAGQGVVAETLNLSQLQGYRTGGTVHIIVNNQLGFTTSWSAARSSTYCSDVAKMVQAPIFHVNGDDPEACVRVIRLALQFRQTFNKDVVVDMVCYRKWGHNEGDDPSMTQPLMYARIEGRRTVRKLYTEALVNRGDLSLEQAEQVLDGFQEELKRAFDETRQPSQTPSIEWKRPESLAGASLVETGVERERLQSIADALTSAPEGFTIHHRLAKTLDQRRESLRVDAVDWATGELLAFGSLIHDGYNVRLSGEDSRRGTFSQRHSVLVDSATGIEHSPLQELGGEAKFFAYDSLLSEFAVVGFEYGYSVVAPQTLVLWEAQFGDFVNGAQVIVDQFLAAAEDKWGQTSRLVLLLPHGYEGQGPEHSSARLERFLESGAQDNYQVVVPTTPAQHFHALRRQMHRLIAKPMIVLTPKSLLRNPAARSAAAAFTSGSFQEVLDDEGAQGDVTRVILCQGKVFYDLAQRRDEQGIEGVAIVRIEQLYPFPFERVGEVLATMPNTDEVYWVQEEPENMGAWHFVMRAAARIGLTLRSITREESASPATGSGRIHAREQDALLDAAFLGLKSS